MESQVLHIFSFYQQAYLIFKVKYQQLDVPTYNL